MTENEKRALSVAVSKVFMLDGKLTSDETLVYLQLCIDYELPLERKEYQLEELRSSLNLTLGSEAYDILIKARNANNDNNKLEDEFIDWLLGNNHLSPELSVKLGVPVTKSIKK